MSDFRHPSKLIFCPRNQGLPPLQGSWACLYIRTLVGYPPPASGRGGSSRWYRCRVTLGPNVLSLRLAAVHT